MRLSTRPLKGFAAQIAAWAALTLSGSTLTVRADSVLIRGGNVYDGSNRPGEPLDVLVQDGRIVRIGKNLAADPPDGVVIDATGLVVAPGFIDLHNHSDTSIVAEATRDNRNFLHQGVTTIVTGNCGGGATDVAKLYATIDEKGAGTNCVHLIPHGSIRSIVMKNDERAPSAEELAKMSELIDREMKAGAWGMSTGLIYIPGKFAETEELIALSKSVAKHGGIYASHIRSEGAGLVKSIDESVRIGREAGLPVHVSHLKASGKANWGLIREACDHIEKARAEGLKVTADQYPYVASSTRLSAMVAPDWARVISAAELKEKLKNADTRVKLAGEIRGALTGRDGGHSIVISRYAPKPAYVGRPLDEIAKGENKSAEEVVIEILLAGDAGAISFGMSEDDVRFGMTKPYVATASDGGAHKPGGADKPHPRAYGTFPRKIRYALDDKVITLEQAIHAATALPAEILGMTDRGRIAPGQVADIVVFDPATFRDKSTFADSTQYADGVRQLLVNGQFAIRDGQFTGKLAGKGLKHPASRPVSALIRADRIWTGDPMAPMPEAIAVRDGVIVAVGKSAELERLAGPETQRITYPSGSMIVPGLIDSHAHLSMLGSNLDELDLRDCKSQEEVAAKVKKRAEERPGDGWILGRNWDQSLWPGQVFPTRASLDQALPDRPVWLVRVDGHAGWANGEALRRAGVTAASKAQVPSDGQMMTDGEGEPTGLFVDGAMGMIYRAVPALDDATLEKRLLHAQAECLSVGLTGIHDAGLDAQERRVLEKIDRAGLLKLRIYGMVSAPGDPAAFFRKNRPGSPVGGSGRYEVRAMKFFIDGAMGSRGALLFDDYADDPGHKGLQLIDLKLFENALAAALPTGWQVCTHAIGDKGNALVLDAFEKAFRTVDKASWAVAEPRWRIEHAQVVRRQDVKRFANSGIIASMQPSHASSDQRWADARLGEDRAQGAYAWSWFFADQVRLAFGSDFPVEIADPLWGLFGAVTRQAADGSPAGGWRPVHKMTMDQALAGFTSGSAYAQFAEARLGRIAPGYRADLTVFDHDLFATEGTDILKAKPLASWVEGEIAFRR
jgi:predicted amidohydrolase YtcJ